MAGIEEKTTNLTSADKKIVIPYVGTQAYATRKTAAQGMMDVALLLNNAAQFKILVDREMKVEVVVLLSMISVSVALQITAGIMILVLGSMHVKSQSEHDKANQLNNAIVGLVFLITVMNLLIGAFILTN